ncbi:MAG TPA: hypothetical protein VFA77_12990 [Candidatus Eisenbacteria bacterium]|nr:hypothetical protein [Candidatus Eisenbacteria bacterium]
MKAEAIKRASKALQVFSIPTMNLRYKERQNSFVGGLDHSLTPRYKKSSQRIPGESPEHRFGSFGVQNRGWPDFHRGDNVRKYGHEK